MLFRSNVENLQNFLLGASRFDSPFMFHLGDMIEFCSPLAFLSLTASVSDYLSPEMRFVPVIGNHDLRSTTKSKKSSYESLKIFNYFFDYKQEDPGYRMIENGQLVFLVLNTFYPGYENAIGPAQKAWLESTLSAIDPSKSIVVFTHHPLFPAGAHDPLQNRDEIHDLFKRYGVKAVFSGHEHLYYHQVEEGILYYVSGGAGSRLHVSEKGEAVFHMLGVQVFPEWKVDILNENGETLVLD